MASITAPLPHDEHARLAALTRLAILDSPQEQRFDDIVRLACTLCQVPIALVSLIDSERQWFKARVGLDVCETPRNLAFCAHAILAPEDVMLVEDARLDPRFADNALVVGEPFIRFYAGAPITTEDGVTLGTVCVIDRVPRILDAAQIDGLRALARQCAAMLQLRALLRQSEAQQSTLRERVVQALGSDDDTHRGLRHGHRVATVGYITTSVAHDFNNLLQTLRTGLDLIRRKAERAADVERLASQALQSVARGSGLISRMLAISRDSPTDVCPVAVADRLDEMRPLLCSAAGATIELTFELRDRDIAVQCDGAQLEAAVLNLIVNARDAMGEAGGVIAVSTRLVRQSGGDLPEGEYLEVQVADTGPGISPEVQARVFEPFYTTKEEGQGTGLGLAQVMGFARNTGGLARVTCRPEGGTTIHMLLKPV